MRPVMVAVGLSSALFFAACGVDGSGDARRPAPTPEAERRAAERTELRAELEWLLSPEPTCPPPGPAVPFPNDEPATMLEILGVAPAPDSPRCPEGGPRP